jgi:predicted methyltransferase MtxX (methanogen marker protein 4)
MSKAKRVMGSIRGAEYNEKLRLKREEEEAFTISVQEAIEKFLKGQGVDDGDYEIENNYHMRHFKMSPYRKDKCFICETKVAWDSIERNEDNGRMYNIDKDHSLNPNKWITTCLSCYRKLRMKDRLDEGYIPYESSGDILPYQQ